MPTRTSPVNRGKWILEQILGAPPPPPPPDVSELEQQAAESAEGRPLSLRERLLGGENYISSPHLARSMFMAWSDGAAADPEALAANLDRLWCKADLYYIEKLTALLQRLD